MQTRLVHSSSVAQSSVSVAVSSATASLDGEDSLGPLTQETPRSADVESDHRSQAYSPLRNETHSLSPEWRLNSEKKRSFSEGSNTEDETDEEEEIDEETGLTKSQKLLGLSCVSMMVVSWLLMSLIGGDFKSPLFERYFVCSLYSVLFLVWYPVIRLKQRKCEMIIKSSHSNAVHRHGHAHHQSHPLSYGSHDHRDDHTSLQIHADDHDHPHHHQSASQRPRRVSNAATDTLKHTLTVEESVNVLNALSPESMMDLTRRLLPLATVASWMSIVGGVLWYVSLAHTAFAVNNTIYQSSCAFVYILACFVTKTATLTMRKTLSVVVCLTGVAMISFSSDSGNDNNTTVMGLMWCVLSTLIYALFIIVVEWIESNLYRCHLSTEDSIFLTAMVGPISLLTFWPVLLVCALFTDVNVSIPLPWESGPHGSTEFWKMVGLAGLDMAYYIFLLLGVTFSNAILMSTGTLLLIPVSFVLESLVLRKYQPNVTAVVGALLICLGFLAMQVSMEQIWTSLMCGSRKSGPTRNAKRTLSHSRSAKTTPSLTQ